VWASVACSKSTVPASSTDKLVATLIINYPPLPSSRDTRWTYMYKVDLRCAAVPSLVTHCSEWLQVCVSLISTHHGQLFILWLRVGHRKNREQRLQPRYNRILVIPKRVITSFQYSSSSISISAGSTVVRGWVTVSLGATRRL